VNQRNERPGHHNFDQVLKWLQSLRAKGMFGTVQLGFQNGEITHIEKKPVLKPGDPLD
jgi:hypothetical protein